LREVAQAALLQWDEPGTEADMIGQRNVLNLFLPLEKRLKKTLK